MEGEEEAGGEAAEEARENYELALARFKLRGGGGGGHSSTLVHTPMGLFARAWRHETERELLDSLPESASAQVLESFQEAIRAGLDAGFPALSGAMRERQSPPELFAALGSTGVVMALPTSREAVRLPLTLALGLALTLALTLTLTLSQVSCR